MKPRLLIVDDDEEIRTQLRWALGQDYDVTLAEDRPGALQAFRATNPAVTMLDLGLPPRPNDPDEGLDTLAGVLALDRAAKVIVLSGQGERENAVSAVGAGAYDFLCKPVEMEELQVLLRRCCHVAGLEREHRAAQQLHQPTTFEGMLGASPPMQAVFNFVRKVAATPAPVLLLGESGTGKEMVANAIHRRSRRQDGPFVAINCNAIPPELLESELFGHEKGSFTGAHLQRKGLVESAGGGTLFLDEIGELPPSIQVKLLRFLQEQRFQRVGGRQEIQADTRLIAATNADLLQGIATGKFREDLYFRLAVVVLRLPPLRDRSGDLDLLAAAALRRFAADNGKNGLSLTPEALRAIHRHPWPGNVRELHNRVQRAVIMADGKRLTVSDLELAEVAGAAPAAGLREAREAVERGMVQEALKRHSGRITSAAVELGISRPTLYELMEKLGVVRD